MASRDLDQLLPEVKSMADAMLNECQRQGFKVVVSCTYRSAQEQDALYAQGRTTAGRIVTNARAGQSLHEQRRALDVYPIIHGELADTKTYEGMQAWQKLGFIGKQVGFEWGGDWTMRDYPHFQLRG
ncbi:M15 family metallopeptidase [Undibacterium sp. Jales W-56]|uniref:M15 family metallopeptidase n=1 Tax=Undibacterium sp. Jales W-56 TaxID=2897325 RepID=UPI0021CFD0C9|nr:M15 family metallopeptidase [Undibacterium sp. Jales W-56]MCU6435165.1 M15 family metallopeptidase [Undibacterium sp. Jales W-56]